MRQNKDAKGDRESRETEKSLYWGIELSAHCVFRKCVEKGDRHIETLSQRKRQKRNKGMQSMKQGC